VELAFTLPQTNADLMTYIAGAVTALFGLVALFAPVTMLRALRLTTHSAHPEAVSEMRSTVGGFYLGMGLMVLMFFEQWAMPMMLGVAWLFAAFGRLVSILSDKGSTFYNLVFLLLDLVLASLPLAAAFNLVES
jgi:uncharacterized membrane protein HdeD (DUF308 family)